MNIVEYTHEFYGIHRMTCKYEYFHKMWDAHFTVPQFDFIFKVNIPEPNKERLIIQRDALGRIVKSQVPVIINNNYDYPKN